MRVRNHKEYKVLTAVLAGVLVWVAASLADVALLPLDRTVIVRQVVANFVAGLVAVVLSLVIHLRHEEGHYRLAIARAAFVAEMNHHVRNAVLPLYIAVQKVGDAESKQIADDAVERINLALRDATADALARGVDYSAPQGPAET
jgi:predicted membrane chloride channel (bestrophin family)